MKNFIRRFWISCVAISLAAGAAIFAPAANAAANAKPAAQQSFASPDAAVDALVAAAKVHDVKALLAILGPASKPLLQSGDSVADQQGVDRFVEGYEAAHSLTRDGDARATLVTGKDEVPFPFPLVKNDAGWRFDTAAGQEEVINRRIGRNELAAIQSSLAYVDAQREYYQRNPDGAKLQHYARRFLSTPKQRDGLYFETAEGEPESPLGALFVKARAEGYRKGTTGKPTPFHGYTFRILEGQGPHAPGGAYGYIAKDHMIGGFGLIATPATYDVTGVMTFVVNQDGVVYQKDLGPTTATAAAAIKLFDPDESWQPVTDQDEAPIPDADAEEAAASVAP